MLKKSRSASSFVRRSQKHFSKCTQIFFLIDQQCCRLHLFHSFIHSFVRLIFLDIVGVLLLHSVFNMLFLLLQCTLLTHFLHSSSYTLKILLLQIAMLIFVFVSGFFVVVVVRHLLFHVSFFFSISFRFSFILLVLTPMSERHV